MGNSCPPDITQLFKKYSAQSLIFILPLIQKFQSIFAHIFTQICVCLSICTGTTVRWCLKFKRTLNSLEPSQSAGSHPTWVLGTTLGSLTGAALFIHIAILTITFSPIHQWVFFF